MIVKPTRATVKGGRRERIWNRLAAFCNLAQADRRHKATGDIAAEPAADAGRLERPGTFLIESEAK